jgi:hypothetical protein
MEPNMSKLKTFSLAAALVLTGTLAQGQVQVKPQCSYEGKAYADGATNPIGQVCNSGIWGTAAQLQTKQCFYQGRAFSDGAANAEDKICDAATGSWK